MRILYITLEDISIHKGSVVHIREIIEGLERHGHFIGLVARSLNHEKNFRRFYNLNKIPVTILRLIKLNNQPYIISSFFLLIYLIRILPRYDIIYAGEYNAVIIAYLRRHLYQKKVIFEINGLANEEQKLKDASLLNKIKSFLIKRAEKIATHFSDKIICVTPQIKSYLIKNFACQSDKVEVIGNGVNTEKFFPILDEKILSKWRTRLGIEPEESVVIFVGNLARWQGVDILIESGIQLLKKRKNIKFLIVGDGIMKKVLMKKIATFFQRDKFIFTGMINYSDIPFLINVANIGVAPFILKRNCWTGVSPLKVFEYMACKKPVVTTGIDGLEFIEKEGVGKIVMPGEAMELAEAIDDLLIDKEKREEMGQKGLKLVVEKFNWDSKINQINRIMKEII